MVTVQRYKHYYDTQCAQRVSVPFRCTDIYQYGLSHQPLLDIPCLAAEIYADLKNLTFI